MIRVFTVCYLFLHLFEVSHLSLNLRLDILDGGWGVLTMMLSKFLSVYSLIFVCLILKHQSFATTPPSGPGE